MSLFNKLYKILSLVLANSAWEKKSIWLVADYPDYASRRRKKIFFHKFGIEIMRGECEFFLDGFEYIRQLYELGDFSFSSENGVIVAKGKDFTTEIHTAEELFILREICLSRDYNFQSCGDVVVIDIGMNVGLASLFFASREDVEHVYGFEPFKPTYLQCLRNLEKNHKLSHKISASNFGLAHDHQTLEVDYDFEYKGQVGIHGTGLIRSSLKSVSKEKIKLEPIIPEIKKIIDLHPGMGVVCKIDCEGGEYDIFRLFSEHGIPEAIKVIMMEWHQKGPERLLDTLRLNNFRSVATYAYRQDVGMIYAFRQ